MTTPLEAAKRLCPMRNEEYLDNVLWNCTCFPLGAPRRWLTQLLRFEYFLKLKLSICFICGKPYLHKSGSVWIEQLCDDCERMEEWKKYQQ